MNKPEAMLNTQEYIFQLGCQMPSIRDMALEPREAVRRVLYDFPYSPPYVIDIFMRDNKAHLTFYTELQDESVEGRNKQWHWFRDAWKAFEAGQTPSDDLPDSYRFRTAGADLSAAQYRWLLENVVAISLANLTSDDPGNAPERDGAYIRLQSRNGGGFPLYTVDNWSRQSKAFHHYYLSLYQLACSALTDPENKQALLELQPNFYGINVTFKTDFVFPLIP